MKKIILLSVSISLFCSNLTYGQVSVANNTAGGTNYLGWDNSVAVPLQIRTNNTTSPQPIDFYTSNAPWMTLSTNGFLGISQTFPFTPQRSLHINGNNVTGTIAPTRIQITDDFMGNTTTDGFQIGNISNDGISVNGTAEIIQTESAPTIFKNWDPTLNSVVERMRFTHNNGMIDYQNNPTDGVRITNPGYAQSNGVFQEAIDLWTASSGTTHIRMDESGSFHGQNIRFELDARLNGFWFNAARLQNQGNAFTSRYIFNVDSVEVGRICPHVNASNWGYYRIGLQPGALVDAARRLEVFDAATAPQMRISQAIGGTPRFTDLETMNNGNFLIQPSNGNVGINLTNSATLTRTLDVNGNGRFRSLPSAIDNSLTSLVVSNANGELFLRDVSTLPGGGGGTGNVNACSTLSTSDLNFIPKWSAIATKELCRSLIFDNSANVGISNTSPLQKLDVNGNINLSNLNQGLYIGNN